MEASPTARLDRPPAGFAQPNFEPGEDRLDRLEIGFGAHASDQAARGFALVAAEFADDDDVVGAESWQQKLPDISA